MAKYQYRPLVLREEIRVVEILPGSYDDSIQVRVHHRPFGALLECEALSYEWGSNDRDHNVFCEGNVILGTKNLITALRRLRYPLKRHSLRRLLRLSQSRWMWIDALCINQDDEDERGQQVKLMGDIYRFVSRVVMWIGEEGPSAQQAGKIVKSLAAYWQIVNPRNEYMSGRELQAKALAMNVKGGNVLGNRWTLEDLEHMDIAPALVEHVSCSFFERLWTVQEVALCDQNKALVLRGSVSHPYLDFLYAVNLVSKAIIKLSLQQRSSILSTLFRNDLGGTGYSLLDCLSQTAHLKATDERDYLFAVLGMTTDKARTALAGLSYTNSTDEVFLAASNYIIQEEQRLGIFNWIDTSNICHEDHSFPTWSLRSRLRLCFTPILHIRNWPSLPPIQIRNQRLITHGFLFDVVSWASPIISSENLSQVLLSAVSEDCKTTAVFNTVQARIDALANVFCAYGDSSVKGSFHETMSEYLTQKLTLPGSVTRKPNWPLERLQQFELKILSDSQPHMTDAFMIPDDSQRRNIFKTRNGYIGSGPWSSGASAAQVGDHVVVFGNHSETLFNTILRPDEDGTYTFIGMSRIHSLEDAPCFHTRESFQTTEIVIR